MTKKVTPRSTKAEIVSAFQELQKEKVALEKQLQQLAKERQGGSRSPANSAEVLSQPTSSNGRNGTPSNVRDKMMQTIESLALLQSSFGGAASELSERSIVEATALAEVQKRIAEESEELQALHDLETIGENTLDELIDTYESDAKAFAEELAQQTETLDRELEELQRVWAQEQATYDRELKERNEGYRKNVKREEEAYRYDLKLQRQIDREAYEEQQQNLYREQAEQRQQQEKAWGDREKEISDREQAYLEAEAKVEAFPQELEENTKKGKDNGRNIGQYQAKVRFDLRQKEVEGQKRNYELQIQSLEETIQTQEARIQSLAKQLDVAQKQVQDLAVKAIEGASNVTSFQTVKEIFLEQSKNQQKTK